MTFVIAWAALQLLQQPKARLTFLWTLALCGIAVSAVLLLFGEVDSFAGRSSVSGLNPIGLGRMAALGALLTGVAAVSTQGARRLSLLAVCGFTTYSAATTGSRGPILAAAIALLLATLVGRRSASRLTRAFGAGAVLTLGYALLTSTATDATARIFSDDSSGRTQLWSESLTVAREHPGGIGFGNLYGHITPPPWSLSTGYTEYSHNMLLEAAVEGGWVALAGLVLVLVISLKALVSQVTCPNGIAMLAVFVFSVANASVSSDLVGNRLMWVMIGAGLALRLRRLVPRLGRVHIDRRSRPPSPNELVAASPALFSRNVAGMRLTVAGTSPCPSRPCPGTALL
ncbi:O-antigen ligase-like membrane protein [Georgenia soli]|uniref:O-antigen ligase-like membrane protein n=2 Tax=Georgenia soli TaxID=638953 RepID=A0A2A9EK87_9MICO|nr:O-antigen ligase-like membrane protein [Georgenia soli]